MNKYKIEIELSDEGVKDLTKMLKYMGNSNYFKKKYDKEEFTASEAIERALALWLTAHNIQ